MHLTLEEKQQLLSPFFDRLDKIQVIEPDLKNELAILFTIEQKDKEELLLGEGDVCKHVWAVLSGATRAFHYVDGAEITSRIIMPYHIIISVGSFYTQTPALESIEVIEPAILAYLSRNQLEKLYVQFPSLNTMVRKITEYYFYMSEKRLYMLRKQKAVDKYKYFLDEYPGLINAVPLKYIASFLGMNQETLSRVRKKISGA
jgi:CRP-like cAMP-binding protein